MIREYLWQTYNQYGYDAVKACSTKSAREMFYLATVAFREEDFSQAIEYAELAAETDMESLVFKHAATYLRHILQEGKSHVYVTGEGFSHFIRGGSNIPLYEATRGALRSAYHKYDKLSLLDIGVGDGLALLPLINDKIHKLTLLEPSEMMLGAVVRELDARQIPYQAICSTLQEFAKTSTENWDVIESTFCLHSIPPQERPEVFFWMHEHGRRVVVAEFDVPQFADMCDPQRVQYFIERYERGLAEYTDNGEIVAQGFLMPVMFGNFDRTMARTTYEQPIQAWKKELEHAGFHSVTLRPLFPYWWATAYLLDAR